MGTKPLLFLHPLSERLEQLRKAIEETAEAESINIFEVANLEEFNQLAPHVGQFLVLCSSPKLCSRMLQMNFKMLRKEQSKVILLSEKQFPKKTVDRLNKLGLTDFIIDSVAAKTLLYKVKLQLRSIVLKQDEEEEKEEIVFENDENEIGASTKVTSKGKNEKDVQGYENEGKLDQISDDESDQEKMKTSSLGTQTEDTQNAMPERRSKSMTDTWTSSVKKTQSEIATSVEEKRNNLPWHKNKEEANNSGKSSTSKIDSVWSSKNNKTPLKRNEEKDIEGKSRTEKLQKDQKGNLSEKEKAIETHWEGEVLDYTKKKKQDDIEEESLYEKNIKKYYEGTLSEGEKLDQNFKTAETGFKETEKDNMLGQNEVEKKEGLLRGETSNKSIQKKDLQNTSEGSDSFKGEMKGLGIKASEGSKGSLTGEGKTTKSNNELKGSFEENRVHKDTQKLDLQGKKKGKSDLLTGENLAEKHQKAPMVADNHASKFDAKTSTRKKNEIESRENANNTKSQLHQSVEREKQAEAERKISLLENINKNRKASKAEEIDGFMRSKFKKTSELSNKKEERNRKTNANTSHSSKDEQREDSVATGLDEIENNPIPQEVLKDLKGEVKPDLPTAENMEGETGFEDGKDEHWDGIKKPSHLNIEDDPEDKRKKRLQELYALREKKLLELEKKKEKRAAAIASEEDLYKKTRNWDDNVFDMDKQDKEHNDNGTEDAQSHSKSVQENLEEISNQKNEHLLDEITMQRTRHLREDIILDETVLSDIERELINGMKDWGEQVIDYSKIRTGNEGITVTREGDNARPSLCIAEKRIESEKDLKIYDAKIIDGDIEEDVFKDEEGETIFHADSKGLESIILILNSYFKKDILPSDILKKVADLLNKERGFGVVSFFYRAHQSDNYTEIFNGHSLYSSDDKFAQWESQKELEISNWVNHKLPHWSDKTFREKELTFLYPFYEGVDHLGFAVVRFSQGIKSEETSRIEVALEAARAVYLSQRHKENGEEAIYNELKTLSDESKQTTSENMDKILPDAVVKKSFMSGGDNLIFIEKKRRLAEEKKAKAQKVQENLNPLKRIWKKMFG